jgi:uncharacterized protein (DUF2235 family)
VVSAEELCDLYYALKRKLESSIDNHWKNYPDSYEENEKNALKLMRTLAPYAHQNFQTDEEELKFRLRTLVEAATKQK